MKALNNIELKNIKGGSVSGTLINSVVRGINAFLDIGRYFGSGLRRIIGNQKCPLK